MHIFTAILAACLAIPCLPGIGARLAYDRAAVLDGEVWRLVTCQLTHFGISHLSWNLGAFVLLGWATARISRRALSWCIGSTLVVGPLLLFARYPELTAFRGLSGVVSALFAFLAWTSIEKATGVPRALVVVVVLAFAAKLGWEATHDQAIFSGDSTFVVVPAAHAAGAVIGALVAAVRSVRLDDLRVAWSGSEVLQNPFLRRKRGPGRASR